MPAGPPGGGGQGGGRHDGQPGHRRPRLRVRAIYEDADAGTVVVLWDGAGVTVTGATYANTYAWFLTFRDGKVVDATAFFDSIAFNDLWRIDVDAVEGAVEP
ncbi:nuclear transport factor 2 family protein [Micromonospora globbae]|uniref:nuclear transport factor 2 family protein n=1 Tax=Micromonospora globbae TaxID=1894969 RepID=UPI00341D27EB